MKSVVALLIFIGSGALAFADTSAGPFDVGVDRSHLDLYESSTSPSRTFIALSGRGLADVTPTFRFRLRILVVDLLETSLIDLRPGVGRDWAVTWSKPDVLLVCGSPDSDANEPLAIYAFDIAHGRKAVERKPSEEERRIVRDAFTKKHGRKP